MEHTLQTLFIVVWLPFSEHSVHLGYKRTRNIEINQTMNHSSTVSSDLYYGADNSNIFVSFHCEILGRYPILLKSKS